MPVSGSLKCSTADSVRGAEPAVATQRLDTTLVKGVRVLELLSTADSGLSVSAVAAELGVVKSNAHRILKTLIALGLVRQDAATRMYSASLKLWEIGSRTVERHALSRACREVIRNLAAETGESVYVSMLHGTEILYLDYVTTSSSASMLKPRPGQRVPAIFTASGKAIVANQDDPGAIVRRIISTVPQASTLSEAMVMKDLANIRKTGFAISRSGWAADNIAIAVPIMFRNVPPRASIGIGVRPNQYDIESVKSFVPALVRAAAAIAEAAGPESALD